MQMANFIFSDFTYPVYEEMNYDDEKFGKFIKSLFNSFSPKILEQIPQPTIYEVGRYLETKYLAKEVIDDAFLGLDQDEMVNANDIVKMYRIDDPEIMNSLYTQEEKELQLEIPDEAAHYQCKNHCNIILESKDKKTISGFTTQGTPLRVSCLMHAIVSNLNKDAAIDLNKPGYADYLVALWWAGFLEGS